MPQIPFEFGCERPNDLSTEMFSQFLLKMAEWQFGQIFQNNKYLYFCV